jgi:hypothetical protein
MIYLGNAYAEADARHQRQADASAELQAEEWRILGLTVAALLDELGPRDAEYVRELIAVHATGWRA